MDKRRINVRGVIWQDGKLLAVKHLKKDGGESEYWAIPGGGLEPREPFEEGVRRELMEETGIAARIGKLLYIQQFASERRHRDEELEFFYSVTNPEDFQNIDLSKTSHGREEIARIEFIDPSKEFVLPKFLSTTNLAEDLAKDQSVKVYNKL